MSNPASIWNPGLDLPIPAVNANDKIQTALIPVTSNGQTVFTLPFAYSIGVNSLEVFVQNNTTFKCRKLVLGEYTETTLI